MKRFTIINTEGLIDAQLWDDSAPLDCEVLAGNFGPGVFYPDRDQAEKELIRLCERYGPKFQIFESTTKTITRRAIVKGKSKSVLMIEGIEGGM